MTKQDESGADIDIAAAAYRRALVASAELARADLDEIEDHFRMLAHDLRESGLPAAEAIGEAARRLGDPRELAREHARVRPTFGARLSRGRAWSAAALFGVVLGVSIAELPEIPAAWVVMELVPAVLLLAGMIARLSWARVVMLGSLATSVVFFAIVLITSPGFALHPINILTVGIVAFLAPWRRGELSRPGLALVLQAWAYGAAAIVASSYGGSEYAAVAAIAGMFATPGVILRARWSAAFAAISSLALAAACVQIAVMPYVSVYWSVLIVFGGTGVAAAAASAVLQMRTARAWLGTFEAVLR